MGKAARPRADPSFKLKSDHFLLPDYWGGSFFPVSVLSVLGCSAAVSQSFGMFMAKKTQRPDL